MKPIRRGRLASLLRSEIASIIQNELYDPRIGFVSVIHVEPTDDLKEAIVKVSLLGTPGEQRTTMRGLRRASGHIQALLAARCRFRNTPVLRFEHDLSIERNFAIEEKIRAAREEDEQRAQAREGDAASAAHPADTS